MRGVRKERQEEDYSYSLRCLQLTKKEQENEKMLQGSVHEKTKHAEIADITIDSSGEIKRKETLIYSISNKYKIVRNHYTLLRKDAYFLTRDRKDSKLGYYKCSCLHPTDYCCLNQKLLLISNLQGLEI